MRYLIPQDDACSGKTRYADTALFWCISLAFVTAGAIAWAETKWPGCAGQFIRTLNCRIEITVHTLFPKLRTPLALPFD